MDDIHANPVEKLLPQSDEEWLSHKNFESIDIKTEKCRVKGVLVTPEAATDQTITIMFGGIPRAAVNGDRVSLVAKFYGKLAQLLQEGGSTSLLIHLPGAGQSEGRVGDFTMRDRISCVQEVANKALDLTGVKNVNLLSTSMGGYIALRAGCEMARQNQPPNQLILLSPAAYPEEIEDISMGQSFRQYARSNWQLSDTTIERDLNTLFATGVQVHFYAYEYDDPPIPGEIQAHYENVIDAAISMGHLASRHTIHGVRHSFRRLDSSLKDKIIDEASVVKTSSEMSRLILKNNK